MQEVVQYPIRNGINAIFEIPTHAARKILPAGVEPIEANHGLSLIGITLFDFTDSPIGPYHELVISCYAVPRMGLLPQHPHAAVYPIVVASSNQAARDHAIDLWKLPHFMEDIHIDFDISPDGQTITGTAKCHKGETILSLHVSQTGAWKPIHQLYQSFQHDADGLFMGVMDMQGLLSEHEEGTGTLTLHEHRLFQLVDLSQLDTMPAREMWMKNGVERYFDLIALNKPKLEVAHS